MFARAVAAPGNTRGIRIDPTNAGAGSAPIIELVAEGCAFAVELDPELLVLDADTPKASGLLEAFGVCMEHEGLRPVVVASGRPGGRHLFVRVTDPDTRHELVERAKRFRLDVRDWIRPPLTPHRLGFAVELVHPTDELEALARLTPAVRPTERARLGAKAGRALVCGAVDGAGDHTRSRVVRAVAVGAANAGWDDEHLFAVLMDPENVGGEKVREIARTKGRANALRYVRGELKRARTWVAEHPQVLDRNGAIAQVAEVRCAAEQRAWRGTGGATDRAVLEVVCGLAEAAGNIGGLAVAVRTVAERAGIGTGTAWRALERLCEAGWLRKGRRGGEHGPTEYALRVPPEGADVGGTVLSPLRGVCRDCSTRVRLGELIAADAFRWRGLGKVRARIVAELCGCHHRSTAELAVAFGVTARTMRRHLAELERYGLAARDARGWRGMAADLEGLAVELGTGGTAELARLRHELHRAGYWARIAAERAEGRRARPRATGGFSRARPPGPVAATAA